MQLTLRACGSPYAVRKRGILRFQDISKARRVQQTPSLGWFLLEASQGSFCTAGTRRLWPALLWQQWPLRSLRGFGGSSRSSGDWGHSVVGSGHPLGDGAVGPAPLAPHTASPCAPRCTAPCPAPYSSAPRSPTRPHAAQPTPPAPSPHASPALHRRGAEKSNTPEGNRSTSR